MTEFFYTTSGCDGCDKYEVCSDPAQFPASAMENTAMSVENTAMSEARGLRGKHSEAGESGAA